MKRRRSARERKFEKKDKGERVGGGKKDLNEKGSNKRENKGEKSRMERGK